MDEGYSLRHVVVEALVSNKKDGYELEVLYSILEQMRELILSLYGLPTPNPSRQVLSNSFIDSVDQAAKLGLPSESAQPFGSW